MYGEFLKGAVTGAVTGAAIALMLDPITPRQRRRAMKKAGYIVSDVKKAVRDVMPH